MMKYFTEGFVRYYDISYLKKHLLHNLGDFCGKRFWWFQPNEISPKIPQCNTKMNMLFYFDKDYCSVDLMKPFSETNNKE